MSTIQFNAIGTLKGVSLRKEGASGDKDVATDLKINVRTNIRDAQPLVGDTYGMELAFYDTEGHPRFFAINDITFETEFKDHIVSIGRNKFGQATLRKFSMSLDDNLMVNLTFMVHINPQPSQVTLLADLLGSEIEFKVQGQPTLL